MIDGFYAIRRVMGAPSATKALLTGAYNNRGMGLEDLDTAFVIAPIDNWNAYAAHHFVQDDEAFALSTNEYISPFSFLAPAISPAVGQGCPVNPDGCYSGESGCYYFGWYLTNPEAPPEQHVEVQWCYHYNHEIGGDWPWFDPAEEVDAYKVQKSNRTAVFSFPTASGTGTILAVSVWAEVRGKVKISFNGTYGPIEEDNQYAWVSIRYRDNSGSPWEWADLAAGSQRAGVYLYWDELSPGSCRRIKLEIETDTETLILWPSATVSSTAQRVVGNYLYDPALGEELSVDVDCDELPLLVAARTSSAEADKYLTSDLSEVAPNFSIISNVRVTFSFRGSTSSGSSYIKPYIVIGDTKYYGTARQMGDAYYLYEYYDDWPVNPATGLAWDYDDYKGIQFGVRFHGAVDSTYLYLYTLYAETEYSERKTEPEYTRIDARLISKSKKQAFEPDKIIFSIDHPIPERTPIAYFREGIRFLGFVWSCEYRAGQYEATATSFLGLLDFRQLPEMSYTPAVDKLDGVLTFGQVLSADPPTKPLHSHIGAIQTYYETTWMQSVVDDIIISHESPCGIMFLLQSMILTGNGDSTGKIPGLGHLAAGRACFGLDQLQGQPQTEHNFYEGETAEAMSGTGGTHYEIDDVYKPGGWYGALSYSAGHPIAGLRRLKKNNSTTCDDEQYFADNDLYVEPLPGSQLILIAGAMDIYVDIDRNDLEDYHLNEAVTVGGGGARDKLADLFQLAGLEIRAAPAIDGRIHLSATLPEATGLPKRSFQDGVNCRINISDPVEPLPDVAVAYATTCRATWVSGLRKCHLLKVLQSDKSNIVPYLESLINDDRRVYTIQSHDMADAGLDPLDWIETDGVLMRIREVEEMPEQVTIKAGKRAYDLSDAFGEWLGKNRNDDSLLLRSSSFSGGATWPVTKTFTIKAANVRRGDLVVRLNLEHELYLASGDLKEASQSAKAIISLNGSVIAPGKIRLSGASGSITLDLTGACQTSKLTDTTNTLSISLQDYVSKDDSPAYYHKVSGTIEQRRAAAVIDYAQ